MARVFLIIALLLSFSAWAQEPDKNTESKDTSILQTPDLPTSRGYPAPLSERLGEDEFFRTEDTANIGVKSGFPIIHQYNPGLNRRVNTYSDLHYSPYR